MLPVKPILHVYPRIQLCRLFVSFIIFISIHSWLFWTSSRWPILCTFLCISYHRLNWVGEPMNLIFSSLCRFVGKTTDTPRFIHTAIQKTWSCAWVKQISQATSVHSRDGEILPVSFFLPSLLFWHAQWDTTSIYDGKERRDPLDVYAQNVIKTTMTHLSEEQK
jgi:hypothetical protein